MADNKKTCLLSEFLTSDAAVHFIGCGGVGTAPLMRIFHQKGFRVSGSDLKANKETEALQNLGLPVFIGEHDAQHLPDAKKLLLVHTSAADDANPEIREAKNRNAVILRRGKALAELTHLYDNTRKNCKRRLQTRFFQHRYPREDEQHHPLRDHVQNHMQFLPYPRARVIQIQSFS